MAYQQQLQLLRESAMPQSVPFRNFVPIDGQSTAAAAPSASPIALTNLAGLADPPQNPSSYMHVNGIAPETGWGEGALSLFPLPPNKRLKEQMFINSQNRPVSTGLGLALYDRNMGGASSSVESSSLFLMLDDEVRRELQRQEAELDCFLKSKGEMMRQAVLEKIQAKQLAMLTSIEDRIFRRLREKESEVESINRKNKELEEQMKLLTAEVASWQNRAHDNEIVISTLNLHLQQVLAQSRNSREGCGDSEVDDTASCCDVKAEDLRQVSREKKDAKGQLICSFCQIREARMLLLPCRHLCLCKNCEGKLGFCPLCQSSKVVGMEVFM
ncbi:S-ribonuclease binding protein 1 [Wolffia australiana]